MRKVYPLFFKIPRTERSEHYNFEGNKEKPMASA
jgi:hypothetical protein